VTEFACEGESFRAYWQTRPWDDPELYFALSSVVLVTDMILNYDTRADMDLMLTSDDVHLVHVNLPRLSDTDQLGLPGGRFGGCTVRWWR
jgi:hypothetical protein